MKSLMLSALLGVGTLAGLLFSAQPAQAQWAWYSYGRPYVWTAPYYGYSYSYYPPTYSYYPPVNSYYYPSWSVPAPVVTPVVTPRPVTPSNPPPVPQTEVSQTSATQTSAASPTVPQTYSANYGPGETGRFVYYSINGLQMCYDRTTGEFWYQDRSSREWRPWAR